MQRAGFLKSSAASAIAAPFLALAGTKAKAKPQRPKEPQEVVNAHLSALGTPLWGVRASGYGGFFQLLVEHVELFEEPDIPATVLDHRGDIAATGIVCSRDGQKGRGYLLFKDWGTHVSKLPRSRDGWRVVPHRAFITSGPHHYTPHLIGFSVMDAGGMEYGEEIVAYDHLRHVAFRLGRCMGMNVPCGSGEILFKPHRCHIEQIREGMEIVSKESYEKLRRVRGF